MERGNNYWPNQTQPSRFDIYQSKRQNRRQAIGENPMQKAKRAVKEKEAK
ncbi:MAG: hypothetical protein ACI9GM_001405 [Salibacteraceae bacterium]